MNSLTYSPGTKSIPNILFNSARMNMMAKTISDITNVINRNKSFFFNVSHSNLIYFKTDKTCIFLISY